ncbi:MAG TPA: hypothetical protein VH307_22900 [Streptosporangiaceae bacterium]|nr:hypothetical protein [Streptosporangiaceae bacterium]
MSALKPAVAAGGTLVCHLRGITGGADLTNPSDYAADEGDPTVWRMPGLIDGLPPYQAKHAR